MPVVSSALLPGLFTFYAPPRAPARAALFLACTAGVAAPAPTLHGRSGTCGTITLAPEALPRAVHCLDYAAQLSASGGIAPYVFGMSAGALPGGVTLSPEGVLAGVPATPGAAAFTVRATDADGCVGTASFLLPVARGFRAAQGQVGLPVPSAGSGGTGDPLLDRTSSTLEVSGILANGVAVVAADVYVTLRHERAGDVELTLVAPDGTRTRLASLRGGTGQDYAGTCFSAGASAAICDGVAPFTGSYRPEEPTPLEQPNGTWTLEVEDTAAGATGVLLDWSLALEGVGVGHAFGRKFAWHHVPSAPPTNLSASESDLYLSSEAGSVRRMSKLDSFGGWNRTQLGGPVRSLYVPRTFSSPCVAVASESGWAIGLSDVNGETLWARDLGRVTCSTDGLDVPPVVQFWSESGCAFRASVTDDLLFFGTAYECSSTTANKVIALRAGDGSIRWTFNSTGSTLVDRVTGMLADPAHDRLFFVTAKADPFRVQSTAFAVNTTTGMKIWSNDVGGVAVPPLLGEALYVVSRDGELAALDPDTGAVRWALALAAATRTFEHALAFDPVRSLVFAVDSVGDIHAVEDLGAAAQLRWIAAGFHEVAAMPHRGWVLASTPTNRVHRLDALTGVSLSFAQLPGSTGAAPLLQLDEAIGGGRVKSRLMLLGPELVTRAVSAWGASDPNTDLQSDDLPLTPAVLLQLDATTTPQLVGRGDVAIDQLTLTNGASEFLAVRTAECVTLTTTLPPDTSLVAVEASQGTHSLSGQELTIRLGTLQIGQSAAVVVRLRPANPGVLVRTYTAEAHLPLPDAVTLTSLVVRARRSP